MFSESVGEESMIAGIRFGYQSDIFFVYISFIALCTSIGIISHHYRRQLEEARASPILGFLQLFLARNSLEVFLYKNDSVYRCGSS